MGDINNASDIIYMFVRNGIWSPDAERPDLTDVVIFKTENRFWAIGQKPKDFERWLKAFLDKKSMDMTRICGGLSLAFMSHVIYTRENNRWKCVKNRFAVPPPLPFSSLEEARLKSVVQGWPEPIRIH